MRSPLRCRRFLESVGQPQVPTTGGPGIPYPRPIDANPYAFLAHLSNAAPVQLTATPELSRLHSALPVPMFGSTFGVGDLAAPDGVAGIVIEPVRDESGVRAWAAAYAAGHGHPTAVELAWIQVLTSLGTSEEAPLQHYVARSGDEPVASASVLAAAGVAGLYCVATAPALRGHHTMILGAEAPAAKLYRRIGFKHRGAMTVHAI
jgi:hypothetical protein